MCISLCPDALAAYPFRALSPDIRYCQPHYCSERVSMTTVSTTNLMSVSALICVIIWLQFCYFLLGFEVLKPAQGPSLYPVTLKNEKKKSFQRVQSQKPAQHFACLLHCKRGAACSHLANAGLADNRAAGENGYPDCH